MVLVAIIIGILTAITQYFKYKTNPAEYTLKRIALITIVASLITFAIAFVYPLHYTKFGNGFLIAIYLAMFAGVYAVVGNAVYIWTGIKWKWKVAGGSVAHIGFNLMLVGMLISSSNKQVISDASANGITLATGKDPMTKQQDNPQENLTLMRNVPTRMGPYEVTYVKDSAGQEKTETTINYFLKEKILLLKKLQKAFT
jgi:cytochrome c-type biogenesis protein CcmF